MRISNIHFEHFRALAAFGPVDMQPMSVIIGENDTGKTSLMLALDSFFTAKKLDNKEDFFRRDTSKPIVLRVSFADVENGAPAARYLDCNGQVRFECSYTFGETRTIRVFPAQPADGDLAQFHSAAVADKRATLNKLGLISQGNSPRKDECDEIMAKYLHDNTNSIQWRDDVPMDMTEMEFRRVVPAFFFIPVTRNLQDNLSLGERSLSGRLFRQVLKTILEAEDTQASLQVLKDRARVGVQERIDELDALLKQLTNDETLSLHHEFDLDPLKGLVIEMTLSDSMIDNIPIQNRGAGIQNTLLLAIFRLLAQYETSDIILGIEEPENSLHPRAQREMLWALQGVSKSAQVITTTHSPVFVDLGLFENNIFLTRTSDGSTVMRIFKDDEAYQLRELLGVRPSDALLSGGGNCAVIVEGDTELHLLPHLFERLGIPWRRQGVSIVPAHGPSEDKIKKMVTILASYGIPTIVLVDRDKEKLAEDLARYCENTAYQSFKKVFVWEKGEIEDYLPVSLCVEVLNEMFSDGDEITETDIDESARRTDELKRVVYEKKGPGSRWSFGKVQFGELVGKKIVEAEVDLDAEVVGVLNYIHEIATNA